jgi:hypothetical protein
MRRTHGNPRNLTADDRRELTHLARQMRLGTLAASLVAAGVAGRRRHRRR